MKSMMTRCLAVLLSMLALATSATSQLEPIAADYRNIRGVDFIASYTNVSLACGISSPTITFHDVASSLAMWSGYNHATARPDAQEELRYVHDYGFNTVRVWLSFQLYRYQPGVMTGAFSSFLADCNTIGLHVIPVLWDADFFEPDIMSLGGANNVNYSKWIMSPSNKEIEYAKGHLSTQHTQYIQDMLTAANAYMGGTNPIITMWDAMNEPSISPSSPWVLTWITETLLTIKAWPSPSVTCVTPPYWDDQNPSHVALARNPNLDVLSFNFYEHGKRDIEGLCSSMVELFPPAQPNQPRQVKPFIAAEAGRVWEGMTYPEVINLLSGVPGNATGHPNGLPGIGFCLFGAMVGQKPNVAGGIDVNGNFPAWEVGDGLFYGPYASYNNVSTGITEVFTRDYASYNGQDTMAAIANLAANNQPRYTWTPRANYSYIPMTPTSYGYANNYSLPIPIKLPDGSTRATITTLLSNAMINSPLCSLQTGNPVVLGQEMNIAAWIGTWALDKDLHYFSTRSNPIVSVDEFATMQDEFTFIAWFVAQPANQNNWWTNALLQQTYPSLFGKLHTAWSLGQYDSGY